MSHRFDEFADKRQSWGKWLPLLVVFAAPPLLAAVTVAILGVGEFVWGAFGRGGEVIASAFGLAAAAVSAWAGALVAHTRATRVVWAITYAAYGAAAYSLGWAFLTLIAGLFLMVVR